MRQSDIIYLKEWFKKILRFNKSKNLNVKACTDSVLLNILNCKKPVIPPNENMIKCLRAVRHAIGEELPELLSPVSARTTPGHTSVELTCPYSIAVSSPTAMPIQKVYAGPTSGEGTCLRST